MSQNVTLQVKAHIQRKVLRDFTQYSMGTLRQGKADTLFGFYLFFNNEIHVFYLGALLYLDAL